jgi:hypothetical protein
MFLSKIIIPKIMVVALEVAIVAVFRVFIKTNVFPTNQVGQLLIGDGKYCLVLNVL